MDVGPATFNTPGWNEQDSEDMQEILIEPSLTQRREEKTHSSSLNAKPILLSSGHLIWVSPEDYEHLSLHKWSISQNGRKDRNLKFYIHRHGYQGSKQIKIYLHREVLGLMRGDGKKVDHIDGDTLNNTRENLRIATSGGNSANRCKQKAYGKSPTSSRFKGVTRLKNRDRWKASICNEGKQHFLGSFTEEKLAALAYDDAAQKFYGEFALLNQQLYPELLQFDEVIS